MSTLLGCY